MSRATAFARVHRRQAQRLAPDPQPTEAFKWAWEKLEGWGPTENGKFRTWTFVERIDKAQLLAWWAINAPLWTSKRKRWPAAEAEEL